VELEQKGYVFRTRSDTEVLLALYLYYGLRRSRRLMAFAVRSGTGARTVGPARDRFGKSLVLHAEDADLPVWLELNRC